MLGYQWTPSHCLPALPGKKVQSAKSISITRVQVTDHIVRSEAVRWMLRGILLQPLVDSLVLRARSVQQPLRHASILKRANGMHSSLVLAVSSELSREKWLTSRVRFSPGMSLSGDGKRVTAGTALPIGR